MWKIGKITTIHGGLIHNNMGQCGEDYNNNEGEL
jgi:hypothetical protein